AGEELDGVVILYEKFFAVIDFSQATFEMTTLCYSEGIGRGIYRIKRLGKRPTDYNDRRSYFARSFYRGMGGIPGCRNGAGCHCIV
ncbi:MAG: hypothetical protein KDH97_19460, partial [Calditrichaeota bacterium]|nr:hypothetical protein [Calditrichota bacterium]